MTDSLIAPLARARFGVTPPPEPSQIAHQLQRMASASFTTLTDTQDAFLHLARRAQERLVIMTPYIDAAGAQWACDLFAATNARANVRILRGAQQMLTCGPAGDRLTKVATNVFDYALETTSEAGQPSIE